MATPDPLAAVSPDVAARTKALLAAVASGGSQGLRAYEQSQGAMTEAKTAAITRAQQRANLMGGPEAQGFEAAAAGQYDRRIADAGNASSSFASHMAALGGAHKNYLDQVGAAVPLVRADTNRQIALKRADIESDLEASLAEKRNAPPSAQGLLGLAMQAGKAQARPLPKGSSTEERNNIATAEINRQLAGHGDQDLLTALAAEIGGLTGTPEKTIAELYSPSTQSSLKGTLPKALGQESTPDEKWLTSNVRGMDAKKAKQALASPEFTQAGEQSTTYFSIAPLDDKGNIDDGSDYDGLSPKEAFRRYVYSLSGNQTMKDAAFKYYGSTLPS